jgi:branched-chain amino acid transport system substrate-binding protein
MPLPAEMTTRWINAFFAALGLAAAPGLAQPPPLVIGATIAQTGSLVDLAKDYEKGLQLWQEEINAAGGLLGRRIELRLLDDGSEAIRVGDLYKRLIRDEKADLLLGPFGSAASLMAGAEAESARRVMVNGAGSSRTVHRRTPRYVFQSVAPYTAYGTGILELARQAGYRRLFILARDDPAPREMAEGTLEAALKLGLEAGDLNMFPGGQENFAPLVAKARARRADAWIAFGEARDAAEMVRNFRQLDYAPRLFFASGAIDPRFIARVGQDAELVVGTAEYHPRFASAANHAFAKAYTVRWSTPPNSPAAEGYAAATLLGEAVRRAGSIDQDKIRAALAALDGATILGRYRVDPASGEQVGTKPALLQIQKGRAEVIWPPGLETAKHVLPFPQWHERQLLK